MTTFPPKDPGAVLDYGVDWSAWLAEGESITGTPVVTADGLTVNPPGKSTVVADGVVTFWLGGGVKRSLCAVTCSITTSQGRTDQRSFSVPVDKR
jgi:hypothetical protein